MLDEKQEGRNKVKLYLEPTSGDMMYFDIARVTFDVAHAFGPDAQYKGRNLGPFLDIEPQNVRLRVKADGSISLGDVIAAIENEVVTACEVVVKQALERERKGVEEVKKQIASAPIRRL